MYAGLHRLKLGFVSVKKGDIVLEGIAGMTVIFSEWTDGQTYFRLDRLILSCLEKVRYTSGENIVKPIQEIKKIDLNTEYCTQFLKLKLHFHFSW